MSDKNLHPEALAIINDIRSAEKSGDRIPLYNMDHIEARNAYLAMRGSLSPPAPEVYKVIEIKIPVEGGNIKARYYRGINNPHNNILPITIFFHGGGWVIGDLETHDVVCRQLSNEGNFDVIAIDYRMGPEYRFPTAINDSITAITWVKNNTSNLPIDINKDQLNDWRAAPILFNDLTKLPPSLILVAGCDPLKDEGIAYGEKLKKAGNNVETKVFDGQIHGFLTMGARINDTAKLISLVSNRIDNAFK